MNYSDEATVAGIKHIILNYLMSEEAKERVIYAAVDKGIFSDSGSIEDAKQIERSYGFKTQIPSLYQKIFECATDMSLFHGICPDLDHAIRSYSLAGRNDIVKNLESLKKERSGTYQLGVEDVVLLFEAAGKFRLASQKIMESLNCLDDGDFEYRHNLSVMSKYYDFLANMFNCEPVISNMDTGQTKDMAEIYCKVAEGELSASALMQSI